MTGAEFALIGRHVYGSRWKTAMAKQLGCSRYTVYKLANLKELPTWAANHVTLLADRLTATQQPYGGGDE